MTTPEILTVANVILTISAIAISYANLIHARRKDFQDSLYKQKVETYRKLIDQCHEALLQLDINSSPFVEIYDFESEKEWNDYFNKEISKLTRLGFEIEHSLFKESVFLPTLAMDAVYEFSSKCIRFVAIASDFDEGLIIDHQDQLHELFFEVVNSLRADLGVDIIDQKLKKRIGNINN